MLTSLIIVSMSELAKALSGSPSGPMRPSTIPSIQENTTRPNTLLRSWYPPMDWKIMIFFVMLSIVVMPSMSAMEVVIEGDIVVDIILSSIGMTSICAVLYWNEKGKIHVINVIFLLSSEAHVWLQRSSIPPVTIPVDFVQLDIQSAQQADMFFPVVKVDGSSLGYHGIWAYQCYDESTLCQHVM